MLSLDINNIKYRIPKYLTIFQACDLLGLLIPHFCYHDKLSIAGNCRMCLIEEYKSPKPLASCAINVNENMKIFTNTELVKKAREGVLEFLLINHPLDCPICDQGGECDLQDQSIVFGGDRGRFYEIKRSVEDKDCGPLIKTIMNRCIHCTRCVRFSHEIAGDYNLGITGRGLNMEIGFYVDSFISSELSGNVIDLCPVGALTSKPFAFTARSWELQHYEFFDYFDSLGSNIRVDIRGSNILRIVPRLNENLNEQWISDKVRFSYDCLDKQRIIKPFLRMKLHNFSNKLVKVSWLKILYFFKMFFFRVLNFLILKKKKFFFFQGFFGEFNDFLSLSAFKDFFCLLGSSSFHSSVFDQSSLISNIPSNHFHQNLENLKKSDLIFLCGINVRFESPIFNVWLRKCYMSNICYIYSLGFNYISNFFIKFIGNNLINLIKILEGNHWFCHKLKNSFFPLIIFGDSFSHLNLNNLSFLNYLEKQLPNLIQPNWLGFFFLHNSLSKQHADELGFSKGVHSQLNFLASKSINSFLINFLYSSNDIFNFNYLNNEFCLNIFQGCNANTDSLKFADIILPTSNFTEKNSISMTNIGDIQKTQSLFSVDLTDIKSDWYILKVVSLILGLLNSNNTFFSLNRLYEHIPFIHFSKQLFQDLSFVDKEKFFFNNINIVSFKNNFYLDDSLTRSSKVMSSCSNFFYNFYKNF